MTEDNSDEESIVQDAIDAFRLPVPTDLPWSDASTFSPTRNEPSNAVQPSSPPEKSNSSSDSSDQSNEAGSIEILFVNRALPELTFLHDEIVVRNTYLKRFSDLFSTSNLFVVDVGANIGLFVLFLDRVCVMFGKTGRVSVLAIEPVPSTCSLLRRNLESGSSNFEIVVAECAVGNLGVEARTIRHYRQMPGNSTFHAVAKQHGPHRDFLRDTTIYRDSEDISVRVRTLDQVLASNTC
jgi:FkbM family methyltransferase